MKSDYKLIRRIDAWAANGCEAPEGGPDEFEGLTPEEMDRVNELLMLGSEYSDKVGIDAAYEDGLLARKLCEAFPMLQDWPWGKMLERSGRLRKHNVNETAHN